MRRPRKRTQLSRSQRLARLLEAGYFPTELPPPFTIRQFARYRKTLERAWAKRDLEEFKSLPETYTIPRSGRARRRLAIVNPINQFKVAKCIADNWAEVRTHLLKSSVAEFRPVFDKYGEKCFFDIDFRLIERRTSEILGMYPSAVKTDISRYYPSIYTHSIPWALYGKDYCKAHLHDPKFKKSFGNRLDVYVRQGQDNQTIGIPVGPETSRVIGEIIGVGLEQQLSRSLDEFSERALRFVDDLTIGFKEGEASDYILANIESALAHYELGINLEKTQLLGVGELVAPEWVIALRKLSPAKPADEEAIGEYFKEALYLAQENRKEAVLKFAIKRSRVFRVSPAAWGLYQNWLLRLTRKHLDCLPDVAQILIERRAQGAAIDAPKVSALIRDVATHAIKVAHQFELAWALFLAKGLRIVIRKDIADKVHTVGSSVCSLITFDLNERGLVDGGLDTHAWNATYQKDGLRDERWLFVYEATRQGWMTSNPCFVSADPLFGRMLSKKIAFYDKRRNVKTTRHELRAAKWKKSLASIIFKNLESYF